LWEAVRGISKTPKTNRARPRIHVRRVGHPQSRMHTLKRGHSSRRPKEALHPCGGPRGDCPRTRGPATTTTKTVVHSKRNPDKIYHSRMPRGADDTTLACALLTWCFTPDMVDKDWRKWDASSIMPPIRALADRPARRDQLHRIVGMYASYTTDTMARRFGNTKQKCEETSRHPTKAFQHKIKMATETRLPLEGNKVDMTPCTHHVLRDYSYCRPA